MAIGEPAEVVGERERARREAVARAAEIVSAAMRAAGWEVTNEATGSGALGWDWQAPDGVAVYIELNTALSPPTV